MFRTTKTWHVNIDFWNPLYYFTVKIGKAYAHSIFINAYSSALQQQVLE